METGSRPTSLKCKMCSACISFTIEMWVLVGGTRISELKLKLQGEFCFLSLVWFCCWTGPILVFKAVNVAVCANIREQIHQQPWAVLFCTLCIPLQGETLPQWNLGDQELPTLGKTGSRRDIGYIWNKSPVKQPWPRWKPCFRVMGWCKIPFLHREWLQSFLCLSY